MLNTIQQNSIHYFPKTTQLWQSPNHLPNWQKIAAKIALFLPLLFIALFESCAYIYENIHSSLQSRVSKESLSTAIELTPLPSRAALVSHPPLSPSLEPSIPVPYVPPPQYAIMMNALTDPETFRSKLIHPRMAPIVYRLAQPLPSTIQQMQQANPEALRAFLEILFEDHVEWWPDSKRVELNQRLEKLIFRCFDASPTLKVFLESNPKAIRLKALVSQDPLERAEIKSKNPDINPHLIDLLPELMDLPREEASQKLKSRENPSHSELLNLVLNSGKTDPIGLDPTHPQNALIYYVQYPTLKELLQFCPVVAGPSFFQIVKEAFPDEMAYLTGNASPTQKAAYLQARPLLQQKIYDGLIPFYRVKMNVIQSFDSAERTLTIPYSERRLQRLLNRYLETEEAFSAFENWLCFRAEPEVQGIFSSNFETLIRQFKATPFTQKKTFLDSHPQFKQELLDLLKRTHSDSCCIKGFVGEPLSIQLLDSHTMYHRVILPLNTEEGFLQRTLQKFPAIREKLRNPHPKRVSEIAQQDPALYYEFLSLCSELFDQEEPLPAYH